MRCLLRLCLVLLLFFQSEVIAQNVVSRASGFWDDPLTWEGGIVPAALTADEITIVAGHDVVVRDVRLVDQLVVADGGTLVVNATARLQLRDGPGFDLSVSGRVDVHGVIEGQDGAGILSSGTTLFFHPSSHYIHQHSTTQGTLPLASWHQASSIEITGYTSVAFATPDGNWHQHFGSMIWNTPNLQNGFDARGLLNHLKGDFIIQSTGAQRLLLSSLSAVDTLVVSGSFRVEGSASVELTNGSTADFTMLVESDVSINTSGIVSLANQGKGCVNVGNNLVIIAGTISESGTGTGEFLFNSGKLHRLDRGASGQNGTFSGRINYTISPMDSLDLGVAVLSPGIGTNNANILSVAGTILVGATDAAGAIQNNTTGGNIRTTVSQRIFLPGSRIIYSGENAQFIGNSGVASGSGTETVIDNGAGVTLSTSITIDGVLQLRSGSLRIGSAHTLTLSNNVARLNGSIESTSTSVLVIADSVGGHRTLDLSAGQLILGTLTIDRRADGASLTFASNVLTNQLNLVAGTLINTGHVVLTENGTLSRFQRASLSGQEIGVTGNQQYDVTYRTTSVAIGPFAKIYSGIELPSAPGRLRRLTIAAAQSLDTVVLTNDVTINDMLDMNRGRFYVQHHTIYFKGSVWSDDTGNFGPGTGTVIFGDSASVQGSSNPVFNSVRVISGSYVRFARNVSVSGRIDFEPGSVVDASSITMTLTGSAVQTIDPHGAVIGNVTVSKTNGSVVQLLSPLSLRGILRFNTPSANVNFRSDGFLTLLSVVDTATTAFGNSMIYRLQNGNTVSGDVTIQRFMSGEGRIYRYLSSPVSNGTVAGWKDDFSITGIFSDPSPAENICGSMTNRNSPSLYFYDEARGAMTSSGYVAYPLPGTTSLASPLEVGRGYSAFIRQCTIPTTIDLTGPINQQQINLPVSYTPGSSMSGWNLVGNPYPCTIDWDIAGSQGWIKTNISPSIAIRDNGGGGFYRYWDGDGEPADLIEGRIAPGQGFWIRAVAANPVLAVREGVKVVQNAAYYRERDSTSVMVIALHHGRQVDKTYLKIREGASNSLDSLDCPKLDNVTYDLATYTEDGVAVAINALEELQCSGEMKLILKDLAIGNYQLEAFTKGKLTDYDFKLRDTAIGVELAFNEPYVFRINDPIEFDDRRFVLTWQPRPIEPITLRANEYTLCDGDSVSVDIVNPDNGVVYELWRDTTRFNKTLDIQSNDIQVGKHSFRVRAVNECRSEFVGDTIKVIRSSPKLLSWKDGEVCNAGVAVLAARSDDLSNVRWYATPDSDSLLMADSLFVTPMIDRNASYYVAANDGSCESKRVEVKVNVITVSPVFITMEGNVLTSSMQDGNKWYFNGRVLEHETGRVLFARESGIYSLRIMVGSCMSEAFVEFFADGPPLVRLYPNPVDSRLTIVSDFDDLVSIELLDCLGQPVGEFDARTVGKEKNGIFDVTKLEAGLYFLRLVTVGRKEEILMVVKK